MALPDDDALALAQVGEQACAGLRSPPFKQLLTGRCADMYVTRAIPHNSDPGNLSLHLDRVAAQVNLPAGLASNLG
jgi:hypothetical protein